MGSRIRTIKLLIYSDTPNQAAELASLIRESGYAVRDHHISDADAYGAAVKTFRPEIALCVLSQHITELPPAVHDGEQPAPPIIAILESQSEQTPGELLTQGADDAAYCSDTAYLKHVVSRLIRERDLQHQLQREAQQHQALQQQLMTWLEHSGEAIAFIHEGLHLYANPRYLQTIGIDSLAELQHRTFLDFIPSAEDRVGVGQYLRELEHGDSYERLQMEMHIQREDGDTSACALTLQPTLFDGESAIQIILSEEIVSTDANDTLENTAPQINISDPVTHLHNHQYLMTLLQDTVAQAQSHNSVYVLFLLHLETGPDDAEFVDQCMTLASERLISIIDERDVLGRFSGNTFLLLSLYDKSSDLRQTAEHMRRVIGDLDGKLQGLTHSRVAASLLDHHCESAEQAVETLKQVFIQAQEHGESVLINADSSRSSPQNQASDPIWAQRISTILKNNRLSLISHPIISLRHDAFDRYLLHLQLSDDDGEIISLDQFKETVQRNNLSNSVDRWIIFNAARQLVEYIKDTPNTQFFIPLIGKNEPDTELFPWIKKITEQFRLPNNSIVLETHVDAALDHPSAFQRFIGEMNKMNVGTYLTGLDDPTVTPTILEGEKIKYLSLESSMVDDIQRDSDSIEILIQQAHRYNTMIVAPSVDDHEILAKLWRLGADMIVSERLYEEADDPMELDLTATLSVSA